MPDPTPLFVWPGDMFVDGTWSPFGWIYTSTVASPPSSDFFTSFFSSFFDIA